MPNVSWGWAHALFAEFRDTIEKQVRLHDKQPKPATGKDYWAPVNPLVWPPADYKPIRDDENGEEEEEDETEGGPKIDDEEPTELGGILNFLRTWIFDGTLYTRYNVI